MKDSVSPGAKKKIGKRKIGAIVKLFGVVCFIAFLLLLVVSIKESNVDNNMHLRYTPVFATPSQEQKPGLDMMQKNEQVRATKARNALASYGNVGAAVVDVNAAAFDNDNLTSRSKPNEKLLHPDGAGSDQTNMQRPHSAEPSGLASGNTTRTPRKEFLDDMAILVFHYHDHDPGSVEQEDDVLANLTTEQLQLIDDEGVDPLVEKERCSRYGFGYDGRTTRRRIFWGSLLADDSLHLLQTISTEGFNIYHTAALVESNTTHTLTPRTLRFPPGSHRLKSLQRMFGPKTKVTVDQYVDGDSPVNTGRSSGLHRQHLQRQAILQRWKFNGMKPDDIGFLSDADEIFTRDFMRALQICDVPEFRPGQDCKNPKILATGLVFESSPECVVLRKLWHPDMIIGECIDLIGNETLHKPPKREINGRHSWRTGGHGLKGDYQEYFSTVANKSMYPLWNAADIRKSPGGRQIRTNTHNAYHLHNFFETTEEMRHKYRTYGEPIERALEGPLSMIHDDLSIAVSCAHGLQNPGSKKRDMKGYNGIQGLRPIFYENPATRRERHEHLIELIMEDEKEHGWANATCRGVVCRSQ